MAERPESIRVNIFGREYSIRGEGEPSYVSEIAHYVDMKMRQMTNNVAMASTAKVAILASLNITDELFQSQKDLEKMEEDHGKELGRLADRIEDVLSRSSTDLPTETVSDLTTATLREAEELTESSTSVPSGRNEEE
ncbi:cell division protein ZapA [Candidatus Fermentibacteria bacterium]|nr:cell division protein ZapA [Candidatus Fermentibacteria bacterium]